MRRQGWRRDRTERETEELRKRSDLVRRHLFEYPSAVRAERLEHPRREVRCEILNVGGSGQRQ